MADTKGTEALGISGFTLGVVSIVLLIFSPIPGILAGIVGLIFCIVQQKRKATKRAKIGLILNIIGIVLNIIWIIVFVNYVIPFLAQYSGA